MLLVTNVIEVLYYVYVANMVIKEAQKTTEILNELLTTINSLDKRLIQSVS